MSDTHPEAGLAAFPSGPDPIAGALNLLNHCVGVAQGENILIVGEEGPDAFFDKNVCDLVSRAAVSLNATPKTIIAPRTLGPEQFPEDIAAAMRESEHTIFFSRLGDQLRFCPLPGSGTKTMCYTHDADYLGAEFGRVPHRLFERMLELLMTKIKSARVVHVKCGLGTDLHSELTPGKAAGEQSSTVAADFTVRIFPVMIFPPLSCARMSGRLAMGEWLTTTSTRDYEASLFRVASPVTGIVDSGRIIGFEGDADEVSRTRQHFERVAGLLGGDAFAVNSWHAGINPKTFYRTDPAHNIEKWGDLVFGSPRSMHFHACGSNPGNIAINLMDPTISFDGELYWDNGRFVFLERPEVQALVDEFPDVPEPFAMRTDIGV